jgi:hypothetical protein
MDIFMVISNAVSIDESMDISLEKSMVISNAVSIDESMDIS